MLRILHVESFLSEVEKEQEMGNGQPDLVEPPNQLGDGQPDRAELPNELGDGQPDRAKLPNELWQLIFQRVPLVDLVMSGRRVCQRWNQIISDENVSIHVHSIASHVCFQFFYFTHSVSSLEKSLLSAQAL